MRPREGVPVHLPRASPAHHKAAERDTTPTTNTPMDKEQLRNNLSEQAYKVTQEHGTEPPFSGEYYKTEADGMYHCIVCGAPLFDSDTKFDSQSGWPSFYDMTRNDAVKLIPDHSAGMHRTEVACEKCGAHLGHLFEDAPHTPTGKRYCINSCALSLQERQDDTPHTRNHP